MKIAVSILDLNISDEEAIEKINRSDADYLHLDIRDGHYSPQPKRDCNLAYLSKKPIDVHLMVSSPFNYISKYALDNTEVITIPLEIDEDLDSLLDYIKTLGKKCGLAIKPETTLDKLEPYIKKLDKVLVMTITPGASHQSLREDVLYKIDDLKKIRESKNLHFEIFVDGGVNADNVSKLRGSDGIISASYVFSGGDNIQERIDKLRESL